MQGRIVLGQVVKAIGLRGEVKLLESEDFWVEALASGHLELEMQGVRRGVRVAADRPRRPRVRVLQLEGVEDRSQAEGLIGAELVLQADALDVPGPQSPRPFQLLGARVLLSDGTLVGSVREVLSMPAHDVLVVRGAERDHLVPAVPEIVKEVDLEAGTLRIDPPTGLLEL